MPDPTKKRDLFLTIEAAAVLNKKMDRKTIPELKQLTLDIGIGAEKQQRRNTKTLQQRVDGFRVAVLKLSMELSKRGVAPRWQGVVRSTLTHPNASTGSIELPSGEQLPAEYQKAIQSDRMLYDLIWLWAQYRKKIRPQTVKWRRLFESDWFNLSLAIDIADRQVHAAKKVADLGLTDWYQVGCLALIRKDARKVVGDAAMLYEQVFDDELQGLQSIPNLSPKMREEAARDKAQVWLAARLVYKAHGKRGRGGGCPYQRIADARLMVWGERSDRSNIRRSIRRLRPKSRRRLDRIPDHESGQ